jgi:hypothetical protein
MVFAAGSLMAADPKDDVSSAVKSLADAGNYSWTQTVENANGGFGSGTSEGKTQKDGLIYTTRTFNDNTFEIVVKGTNVAMNNGQDGWQTAEEMAQAAQANGGGGGGGFRGGGFARFVRTPTTAVDDVLKGVTELKMDGDAYVGDLTEDGAKALASPFRGRRGGGGGGGGFTPPEVTDAKGSVKFWIKDGKLSRYEFKVTGKTTNRDGDPVDLDRTTTVEIKDIGTTKITVPDDVLKKIGG